MAGLSVQIKGLDAIIKKLSPALIARPVLNFMTRSAIAVSGEARRRSPVDTGRLRGSITHAVTGAPVPTRAVIGTNVAYAPFMEFGTGRLSDGDGGKAGHFPPGAALNRWAQLHGFSSGYAIARAIAIRGGLRPRRYLRGALESSMATINRFLDMMKDEILVNFNASK